jgi:hypothetical membrane protein
MAEPGAVPEPAIRLGPLVHRTVHHGAALWVAATVQFVAAMIAVQLRWGRSYSLSGNYISDLGNTALSPWHDVFNASVIVFGLLVVLGAIMVKSAFPSRRSATIGLTFVALAGIGAIGVGASPENVSPTVAHSIFSLIAFVFAGLALIVLGVAMFRDTRWDGYRAYTMFSGLVVLVALSLFVADIYPGLGPGGMERLIVAPALLWAVVAGVHLLRVPTYARTVIPRSAGG